MISVLHSDIRKGFDAKIIQLLPQLGMTQTDVAWPNARFVPPAKGFLRVFQMPGQSRQASFGGNCQIELVGVYQISIFEPKDTGVGEAERKAAIILNEFPLGRVFDICRHWVIIRQAYSSPVVEEEDYLHLPVALAYYCYAQQQRNAAM